MPNVKKLNLPGMTALSLTWFTDSSIQRHCTNERNTLAHTISVSVNPCFITLQWRQLTSALCKWNKCTTSNNISFSHLLFHLEPSIKWLNDLDRIFLHCVKQSRNKPATVSIRGRAWCTCYVTMLYRKRNQLASRVLWCYAYLFANSSRFALHRPWQSGHAPFLWATSNIGHLLQHEVGTNCKLRYYFKD
jgi:hypothetical protein